MANFLTDTFTEASATTLISHTPDVGGAWAKNTASTTGSMTVEGGMVRTATISVAYNNAATPPTADEDITAVYVVKSYAVHTSSTIGGRASSSALTYYAMRFNMTDTSGNGTWDLVKCVSGTTTVIQSSASELFGALNASRTAVLTMHGTALALTVDGVLKASGTDSALTGAGTIIMRGSSLTQSNTSTGLQVDSLAAIQADLTPAPLTAPFLSWTGMATTGTVLTTSNGTWTNSPTGYTYQWKQDGVNISGQTASTYTLVSGDLTHAITCAVTATNATGSATTASNTVTPVIPNIAANDAGILFSPYTWDKTSVRSQTVNAGAYLRTIIVGSATTITANFDVAFNSGNVPQIAYRVDNGGWQMVEIASAVTLTLPAGNTWTKHTVEIVVKATSATSGSRWAGLITAVKFQGFTTVPTNCTASLPTSRALNILAYGDSITEGTKTLNSNAAKDTDQNDATQSWAWRLSETLGAEVGVVGWGSQGITVGGAASVPGFGSSLAFLWSGVARTFSPSPDLIVINQGYNDNTADTVATYITNVNTLLAATPATTLIALLVPFSQRQAANIALVAAGVTTPSRVKVIDTTGWWSSADSSDTIHPSGYANVNTIAPLTAAALRVMLRRGASYIKKADLSAKLITPVRI